VNKLRVLDLFSGIGGFSLGLERTGGFETVAFCEIEPFPRKVLANRWFQPLTHVSARGFPRVAPLSCQRGKRETRGAHRFGWLQGWLQSVSQMFLTFWHDTSTGNRLDAKTAAKIGLALLIANEIRGLFVVLSLIGAQSATLNLTPIQITAVIAVFFVTSIGAVGLAWALRKWNG